jgi:eukaryotic-like serine/threonine-protein kinase
MAGVKAPSSEWVGRELGGYRVIGELGRGGMGIVLEAEHVLLGRRVAIKTIRPDLVEDPALERRFMLEARAIAALDHPSIVAIYDFAFDGDTPYMVMELVPGRSLDDLIDAPVTPRIAIEALVPVAAALDYAHAHGVVHRDVKPANVLLADDGRTLVMDFGLALLSGYSLATERGTVIGTPEYIAPEQLTGASVDGRADVYSLAAVVFELVAGRKPFSGGNWADVAARRLVEPAPRLEGLPWEFCQAVADGLDRDPDQRPPTARALISALAYGVGLTVSFEERKPVVRPLAGMYPADREARLH